MNPTPCFRLKDSSSDVNSSTGELITVTGMNESPVYQPTCNQAASNPLQEMVCGLGAGASTWTDTHAPPVAGL